MILNNNIIKENKNLPQLSPSYLQLTRMLWDKNKKGISFSPNNFMETIEKMNPLFKNGQKNDFIDFIIFIIEQIHRELKRPINFKRYSVSLNRYDKINAFLNFMNDFQNECSIISDTFFGITETTNACLYCKNVYSSQGKDYPKCYNYGIFNCLIFPLEEVRNFRNQNNSLSLDDCFFYNQKTERFNGENKNYCNICKKFYDSEYTSIIYSSPNVLVLILKRAKNNIYDIKLDFPEILDITQFVVEKDYPQMIYNLIGVVTHMEQSDPNEHYTGFCKSPINNRWYSYNDAFVNFVEDVQKEIINFGIPIILFYQKSN
jgi:ubiquitin C-terminal hydrolase